MGVAPDKPEAPAKGKPSPFAGASGLCRQLARLTPVAAGFQPAFVARQAESLPPRIPDQPEAAAKGRSCPSLRWRLRLVGDVPWVRTNKSHQLGDRLALVEDVHRPPRPVGERLRGVDAEDAVQRAEQVRRRVAAVGDVLAAGTGGA